MTPLKCLFIIIVVGIPLTGFVLGFINKPYESDVNKMVKRINECSSMNRSLMEALTSSDPRDIITEPAPIKH